MASPLDPSREATPSSTSSSHGMSNDVQSSYSASASSSQGQAPAPEDVDRFLKRMDMEKKMQALQQRLELASVKASHGWTDMSIGEIEDKLPAPPPRRLSSIQPIPAINLEAVASSSRTPYEPPSPSRPWQLMDVLWQPLPPPSRGPMSPVSPLSTSAPRRRSKRDDLLRFEEGMPNNNNGHGPSQRRFSSAAMMAYLGHDPYPVQSGGRVRKEKRSQSHSHTTTQDVDAAKALTAMLGGHPGSGPSSSSSSLQPTPFSPGTPPPRHRSSSSQRRAPSTAPPRPGRRSHSTSDRGSDGLKVEAVASASRDEEDTDAAELMMFLAHSPSAAGSRRYSPSESTFGGTARVLFADGPSPISGPESKPVGSSNLALAPPITAGSLAGRSDD